MKPQYKQDLTYMYALVHTSYLVYMKVYNGKMDAQT